MRTLTPGSKYSVTYLGSDLTVGVKTLTVGSGFAVNNKAYDGNSDASLSLDSPLLVGVAQLPSAAWTLPAATGGVNACAGSIWQARSAA